MSDSPALDLRWPPSPEAVDLPDLLYASLDDFQPLAIDAHAVEEDPESPRIWRVYFRTGAARDGAHREMVRLFAGYRGFTVSSIDVPDEDWAKRNQAELRAIRVGRIVVAPPWDRDNAAEVSIVIEPSTGFGTGHHETTRLCLGALQQIDVVGRRVIDVGTGSGVLAIAAARLGAASVVAVDNDPEALRNARENIELNGGGRAIAVVESELAELEIAPADVVLANLTAPVLVRHATLLRGLLRPGGLLIASGFGEEEERDVSAAFDPLSLQQYQREGAWSAMVFGARGTPPGQGVASTSSPSSRS